MWLDLGCANSPRGDVNIDRYYEDSPHTQQQIKPKEIKNFILASAGHTPIRDNAIYGVSGYHLIEHLLIPTDCISDMVRMAKKYLIICVPNHPILSEHHRHFYSWSQRSLETLLGEYGQVVYSRTRLMWWNSDRALKAVSKMPHLALRRLVIHLLNMVLGTEILVIVDVSGEKKHD